MGKLQTITTNKSPISQTSRILKHAGDKKATAQFQLFLQSNTRCKNKLLF